MQLLVELVTGKIKKYMLNEKRQKMTKMTKKKNFSSISLYFNSHTYCSIQGPELSVLHYTTVLQGKRVSKTIDSDSVFLKQIMLTK